MPTDCIPFKDTGYFSTLITDYLSEKEELKPFYNRFPNLENFKFQIEEKQASFPSENRKILAETLIKQYQSFDTSLQTLNNIEALRKDNTFTVTTGHQLNLFTGPLYFLYKIISTINLTKNLKATYPEYN
ncbi:MAG TPA: bacillithiol biosynthesis BshC, partial [Flavobacteriaceae bacterium]|nr:bacillithiol biosynthesis BshC [Flavobacteriaceae bacterium]